MTDLEAARDALVDRLANRGFEDDVLAALRTVPRHAFVPADQRATAYEDRPLPIGNGQTISAPHMVAIMADELEVTDGDQVLEIGTGCGYHAAVTAELVGAEQVYSVEVDADLAARARETLAETGYGDVSVRVGDGRDGWPAHAPYDAAYLTCAAPTIPDAVLDQVRDGGTVLAPVGRHRQELVRATVDGETVHREELGGVRFVRLRGE
ncbi:MAG: protein-L-isoaspartate(D-aspartate) O-methyltransferase [Halobacteriaceae archaeon]